MKWLPLLRPVLKAIGGVFSFMILIFGAGYASRKAMSSEGAIIEARMMAIRQDDLKSINGRFDTIEAQNRTIIGQQGEMIKILMKRYR
jgi:hypothetical protein